MSEFDPRGQGVKHFSNISEIQKILIYLGGGEIRPKWEFFPNFSADLF